MQIDGANSVVVGGASGLGEATARYLADRGSNVTILDFNSEKAALMCEILMNLDDWIQGSSIT